MLRLIQDLCVRNRAPHGTVRRRRGVIHRDRPTPTRSDKGDEDSDQRRRNEKDEKQVLRVVSPWSWNWFGGPHRTRGDWFGGPLDALLLLQHSIALSDQINKPCAIYLRWTHKLPKMWIILTLPACEGRRCLGLAEVRLSGRFIQLTSMLMVQSPGQSWHETEPTYDCTVDDWSGGHMVVEPPPSYPGASLLGRNCKSSVQKRNEVWNRNPSTIHRYIYIYIIYIKTP